MNRPLHFLVAAGLIGGGCWVASAWGQQSERPANPSDPVSIAPVIPGQEATKAPSEPTPPPAYPTEADQYRADSAPYPVRPGMNRPWGRTDVPIPRGNGPVSIEETRAFHDVLERLRSAKEGPDKEGAKKGLLHVLEQSFNRDLEHREREVSEIESRVKKLREQIERRKKAKDEIVSLRLKTIINETEGLGFPDGQDFGPFKHPAMRDPAADVFEPRPTPTYPQPQP
jgi:hypothetical protein